MTNRNLEIFVAVAECGKMSAAARTLFITQSSVSQAIAEIEREYGVRLFDRLSRSLYLTETGRDFLIYAKKALSLHREMEDFLRDTSQMRRIRIGATVTVGTCLISPLAARLKEQEPDLRAEVTVANTHELEDKLLHSQLDIGLVEGRIIHPDLVTQPVMGDEMVLICGAGHAFFGRPSVPIEALADLPLILREPGSGTRAQLESAMQQRGLPLNGLWECCNSEAILSAVQYGHGASVISRRLVEGRCGSTLWSCAITGADLTRTFDLVFHKDKLMTGAMRRFIDLCGTLEQENGGIHA